MKRLLHLAVALAACGMASQAWAQDAQQDLAAFQRHLKSWPFAHTGRDMPTHFQGYHPDHKEFCVTCYGGGGCGREETCVRCGACNGSKCQRDKIETCRRCGVVGRVFFYECRRLGCGEEGGNGCAKGCPMTIKMCNGKTRTVRPAAFAKWLTGEGESVFWLGGGPDYIPLLSCYGQSKNYEGPRDWYGHCCGCYESYLSTPFDARGPLNFDPALANNCFDEDSGSQGRQEAVADGSPRRSEAGHQAGCQAHRPQAVVHPASVQPPRANGAIRSPVFRFRTAQLTAAQIEAAYCGAW
jgi:hypothetical protein